METNQLTSPLELEQFLVENQQVAFSVLGNKTERYTFISKTLIKMRYNSKLKSLPNAQQYLKSKMSFQILDDFALKISNNPSAKQLRNTRLKLFNLILNRIKPLEHLRKFLTHLLIGV